MTEVELLAGERNPRETRRAVIACNDYLRLGPARSLAKLRHDYVGSTSVLPPTRNLRVLQEWSARYGWVGRAAAYDAQIEAQKDAHRRQIMESGLALDYERVLALEQLVADLLAQYYETLPDGKRPKLWLRDVKGLGGGESFQVVDIERFNAPLIEQLRGALADLAQETGGRQPKKEATPLGIIDYAQLSDAQLERIANGEDPLKVLRHGGFSGRPG